MDKYEVEDTMNTFLKKCLASCEADSTRDSLVYTLHDLQLDYLKNKLRDDPEREKHLHRQFVEEYFRQTCERCLDYVQMATRSSSVWQKEKMCLLPQTPQKIASLSIEIKSLYLN